MERNFPAYYRDVSLRLFNVLDKVGLREDVRWKRINMMVQVEKIQSMSCDHAGHIFGSQAEATTTPGLQSDIDMLRCVSNFHVLQDLQSWTIVKPITSYLMVCDESTPPGHVKLQRVSDNGPYAVVGYHDKDHMLDASRRSSLCNCRFDPQGAFDFNLEKHGPSRTVNLGWGRSSDLLLAIKVRFWPVQASRWENRHRFNNYPSKENIALIKQTGALLVPVSHPHSTERHLEYRISISCGEKLLVWKFNSTQYKCYVLLKMINKHFVQPIVGEKALSSYHCKTCVFYMLESTPPSLWQPENLLLCVELCLRTLCKWTENSYCPNYFIPEENMFRGKVYGHIQVQLLTGLHNLLKQEGKYLLGLSCDDIGQRLTSLCQTPLIHTENRAKDGVESLKFTIACLISTIENVWWEFVKQTLLENSGFVEKSSYSEKLRQTVDTVLQAYCSSSLGSHLASQCMSNKVASQCMSNKVVDQERLDIAHKFLLLGCSSDVASGKLKLAAFYLMQDNFVMAENVFHQIRENYTHHVMDLLTCPSKHVLCRILEDNLSTTEFMRKYVVFPVHYLQSEINCTPEALIPEMSRSKGLDVAAVHRSFDIRQHCAVVDPIFYLPFLEYQCHFRQGKVPQKKAALGNMLRVLTYKNLKYENTAQNLLAYCLKQEGSIPSSLHSHEVKE